MDDPSGHVTFIKEDMAGRLWIGAWRGGLNVYDPTSKLMNHFEPYDIEQGSKVNFFMWDMYQTRDGTIWISSAGGGGEVFKLNEKQDFLHFTSLENQFPGAGSPNNFWEGQQGELWITLEAGGLIKYDDGIQQNYRFRSEDPTSIAKDHVHTVHGDSRSNLWLIMGNEGGAQPLELDYCEVQTGLFQHYMFESEFPYTSSWTNTYRQMIVDSLGNLWISSLGAGLISFDPDQASFTQYRQNPGDPNALTNDMIFSIYQDQSGIIWVGGGGAPVVSYFCFLDRFDPRTGVFEHYPLSSALNTSYILGITEDREGNIWFAFFEQGLGRLDISTGEITYYNQSTGFLPQDDIRSLARDSEGIFWMSTEDKLMRFDPVTKICSSFEPPRGLKEINFKIQSSYFSRSQSIYFAAEEGFFEFSEKDFSSPENLDTPELVFSSFSYIDESSNLSDPKKLVNPIWDVQDIMLSFQENTFSIGFSCLEFQDPESNRYEYKLEPINDKWLAASEKGLATFSNLSPGEYLLKVRGSRSDGDWSPEKLLKISIKPPWWRAWWAYFIYAVIFLSLLYTIRYLELKKQRSKMKQQEAKIEHEYKINEQLRKVDKLKDQFLANTSHELRTPLQGIIGLSEAVHSRAEDQSDRENLAMVISAGKRLASLVNDILDFSRLKNDDLKLNFMSVDMKVLSDTVGAISRPLFRDKKISLINAVDPDISPVRGDENRLFQIMHNLIDNARKFTESGHIKISAQQQADYILMSVEDTGIGIPADKKELIFQAFQQVDGTISRRFSGTGLGLSVTKKLVELHGGEIWVDSEEGNGSTFYFTLPISKSPATTFKKDPDNEIISRLHSATSEVTDESRTHNDNVLSASKRIRILIVDDEPINHQVLKNHLSGDFYDLTHALNGEDGLKAVESSEPFDLVLLDIMMPRMSGYEVCQKIREKYPPNELPILLVSAKNQVEDLVEGLNTGANDYIVKPFSRSEFLARLKTHLNLHLINSATRKFVPIEFLNSLGYDNVTDVILGDYALKNVTVLISDIRNYTTLAEKMKPEENFGFISAYARRMGPIISENKGFINQYVGDGIISIYPHKSEDAIRAAIRMQQAIIQYNGERIKKGHRPIVVGMGLDTGPLIMGIIGSEKRNDAAVISDTVNTASRMEGLTKYFGVGILASESTYNQISNPSEFNCRFLGIVKPKGKEKIIKIYEFYDGLEEQQLRLRILTNSMFQEGLRKYYDRSFAEAVGLFKSVLEQNPDDTPSIPLFKSSSSVCGW